MKKGNIIFIVGVVLLLLVCTFYDLQISMTLFNNQSIYGKFFEAAGELPMTYIGCFSAAALFLTMKNTGRWTFYLGKIGFVLLVLFFSLTSIIMINTHLPLSIGLKIGLLILTSLVFYLLAKAVPAKHYLALKQAAKVGLILAVLAILVVTILKMFWGRMRFREMTDPIHQFTRWYLPQGWTINNELMSFPSGHAANSSVILWLSLLPTFVSRLAGKERLLEGLAAVWIVLVMVSRVVMGAHFATDVTVGMLLSISLFFWLKKRFITKNNQLNVL
ncbi:phosphatase PAP2 family protein [Isobaculum melis]|uniref:PAP2 superfamily protein n=1 Tax=Isobaculum melis TaxID=142588 RepID=A0A1H9Q319_9LACT|nr:phosphatase PAP2 family protein [Isobaculum melis]SER54808.1 PAP2 superfamily protein [Isobaculum melis]